MECIVTYQKSNGEIFVRGYDFTIKEIGQETSMGWKIINIHYRFGDNYYIKHDYDKLRRKYKEPLRVRILLFISRKINKIINKYV